MTSNRDQKAQRWVLDMLEHAETAAALDGYSAEDAFEIGVEAKRLAGVLRNALAQPAAGEPKAEFFVEFETLRKAMSIYGLAAPASNSELGALMERYAVELIEAVADRPFPAPPAAAHGDEAMDELRRSVAEILGQDPDTWPSHGNAPLAIASALALATMRGQADDGGAA